MTGLIDLWDLDGGPGHDLLEATRSMGFSEPVARAGLEAELAAWRAPGAMAAVRGELSRDTPPEAFPGEVLVLAARTLPVSAMRVCLMARMLGARVRLKTASGQERLAEVLNQADPGVQPAPFAGQDAGALRAHLEQVDTVVVLGADSTIAQVRAQVPERVTFVGYGHRVSAAWVAEPSEEAARGLAQDLCAWDQSGCLSPQVAWVGGDRERFADQLERQLTTLETDLPMRIPPAQHRARTVMRSLGLMGGGIRQTLTSLLCLHPSPSFRASSGYRSLWILPLDPEGPASLGAQLSSLSVTGDPPRGLDMATRRCAPGELQRPPLTWPHDGRPNLGSLLRAGFAETPLDG